MSSEGSQKGGQKEWDKDSFEEEVESEGGGKGCGEIFVEKREDEKIEEWGEEVEDKGVVL